MPILTGILRLPNKTKNLKLAFCKIVLKLRGYWKFTERKWRPKPCVLSLQRGPAGLLYSTVLGSICRSTLFSHGDFALGFFSRSHKHVFSNSYASSSTSEAILPSLMPSLPLVLTTVPFLLEFFTFSELSTFSFKIKPSRGPNRPQSFTCPLN